MPIVARLAVEHRELELDVVLDARRLDFFEDDLDVAVREGALADSSLTIRKLGEVGVQLYAAPRYLATHPAPRRLEDLARHDLLAIPASSPASDLATLRDGQGRRLGLVPRIRVNDLLALGELAERGAGIAVLPDYVAAPGLAGRRLVRVLPRTMLMRVPLHVVYPSRRHLARRVQVVIEALVAARPSVRAL
jgi:DNA-binding transcriptional LysR family regulator